MLEMGEAMNETQILNDELGEPVNTVLFLLFILLETTNSKFVVKAY